MVTIIDKGWCDEDDPIFTEGITVFTVMKRHCDAEQQPKPKVPASILEGEAEAEPET